MTVVDAFADPLYGSSDLLLSPEAFEQLRLIDQGELRQNVRQLFIKWWNAADEQDTVGTECDANFGMQRQFKTGDVSPMEQIGCVTTASTATCDLVRRLFDSVGGAEC